MVRAVLDTNIIISSIFWKGNPFEVTRRGIVGEFQLVTSREILGEVGNKLRNKFDFPQENTLKLIDLLAAHSQIVEPSIKCDVVRDKSDNKIIECALEGKANFIITGDLDLLEIKQFRGIKIVTAKEFLKVLG